MIGQRAKHLRADVTHFAGDFLDAAHTQSLLLQGRHQVHGPQKAVAGACVQPVDVMKGDGLEPPLFEINPVEVGDLQLPTRGGL